ncbi:hypothetical protein THAOC_30099 [Thalassiosira oceanica]|uniref:peptidylprolyl isomerase n=1 Tax=Thalassiosira oceanica TaxID=159749 RepID=K0RPI6_THAOC|nr:hypothetical protein THAOC_30099 [Thalassiosira oceanica]|eukprot:EJK50801.1 hypothetical protein THAOC_30099 [Thalassiosira oceanica]
MSISAHATSATTVTETAYASAGSRATVAVTAARAMSISAHATSATTVTETAYASAGSRATAVGFAVAVRLLHLLGRSATPMTSPAAVTETVCRAGSTLVPSVASIKELATTRSATARTTCWVTSRLRSKSRASPSVHHSDRSDEGVLLGHAVTLEMPVDESSGSAFPEEGDEVHPAEASESRGLFMSMPTRAAETPTKNPNSSTTSSGSESFPPTISAPTLRPTSLPSADGEGRLIEFTVENLNGEPGKKGTFIVLTRPDWAPIGAERVETLSQFGINGDPEVQAKWRSNYLEDEPVAVSNSRGTISFASAGPGTRTTQLFINLTRNSFLNRQGFSPIGQVVEGMDVVERFYSGYGDGPSSPIQWKIQSEGNEYLQSSYPKLSYFSKVQFK